VVVPYRPGADGRLVPEIPGEGPCRDPGDGPCRLVTDHWRERTTGPGFPLLVMRCLTHRRGFTLYPHGHVPYGREAIAPVAPDGASSGTGPGRFVGTVFEAAVDASRGRPWPRERRDGGHAWWPTMWHRLAQAEVWLGVSPELGEKLRERRAADLEADLLPLTEGARGIEAAPGYRSRGRAVVKVLGELPADRSLLYRLLRAGHAAGLFGEPLVPVRPGGPLRSLTREAATPGRRPRARDPPRICDLPPADRRP